MGSVKVTVFGRVKPCDKLPLDYKIKSTVEDDLITFSTPKVPAKKSFRFKKIFGEDVTQEEIFETVARPVIKNLFSGYNGTIFTYGQTGSGKTYTMTGDVEEWTNTGLIPRVIQELFNEKSMETLITVSFCEIYNEHIYDLVRNDLPDGETAPINILTDSSCGITNFRNLSSHRVQTADEAMQLFLKGDSNKMVAETGSNFRSSRSHAIFSISLEFQHPTQENFRMKPVLYLVDLAGSERLSKCKTPLSNVSETRYINLSLHYLEQVLLALRQPGRAHIPYRNSLMTALLKNSLGGNSITIMIATLSVFREDAEETAQTCRFAERVALIKNEIKRIELANPEKEIDYLKKENERLKTQLKLLCKEEEVEQLNEKEKERCIETVQNFIQENDIFDLPLTNVRRMEYCFKIMRDEILKKKNIDDIHEVKTEENKIVTQNGRILAASKRIHLTTKSLEQVLYFHAPDPFKTVRNIKSIRSIGNVKSVKSVNYLKSIQTFSTFERKNLVDMPKINIVYGESPQDKENESPVSAVIKVKSSNSANEKGGNLNPTSSSQTTQIFFQTKAYGTESNCLQTECENNLKSCISTCAYLGKKDENKNLVGNPPNPPNPPRRIISFLFNELFNEEKPTEVLHEKKSLEKECKIDEEKTSVPSSNDFMEFTSKCVPLTGDKEVDEEIVKFYKSRYQLFKDK